MSEKMSDLDPQSPNADNSAAAPGGATRRYRKRNRRPKSAVVEQNVAASPSESSSNSMMKKTQNKEPSQQKGAKQKIGKKHKNPAPAGSIATTTSNVQTASSGDKKDETQQATAGTQSKQKPYHSRSNFVTDQEKPKDEPADNYSEKRMYIKPEDKHKLSTQVIQNIASSAGVKIVWKKATELGISGSAHAIKDAKEKINSQLQGFEETLTVHPNNAWKLSHEFLQSVCRNTGTFIAWRNSDTISLVGHINAVKAAEGAILCKISSEVLRIPAPSWVYQWCSYAIDEALRYFRNIKIWYDDGHIHICGPSIEINQVYPRIRSDTDLLEELPVFVKKDFHGVIVGKNGCKVTEIQNMYRVQVVIPPQDSAECNILIRGRKGDTHQAKREILHLTENLEELSILLRKEVHGALIGKNGAKINEIQNKFNVYIRIPAADSAENMIMIRGKKEDVHQTKKTILDMVKNLEEAQKSKLVLGLSSLQVSRISNDLCKRMERLYSVKIIKNGDFIEISGDKNRLDEAKESIIMEVDAKVESCISLKNVWKPLLKEWINDHCRSNMSLKIDLGRSNQIVVSGHPQDVSPFVEVIKKKISAMVERSVAVKKEFHGDLLGKLQKELDDIEEKFHVKLIIPPRKSKSNEITVRGDRLEVDSAANAMLGLVQKLEKEKNDAHLIQLPTIQLSVITDRFCEELQQCTDVKVSWQQYGILLTGQNSKFEEIEKAIMTEVNKRNQECLDVENSLKPHLHEWISQQKYEYPNIEIDECVHDKIILTGHPVNVTQFSEMLRLKISETKESLNCLELDIRKDLHRNIIGKKGENIKRLKNIYKVEVVIPPPDALDTIIVIKGSEAGTEAAKQDILNLVTQLDAKSKKTIRFTWDEMDHVKSTIQELRSDFRGVSAQIRHTHVTLTGPYEEIEKFAVELREKMKEMRSSFKTLNIPVTPSQALALLRNKVGMNLKKLRQMLEKTTAKITFKTNPPQLTLKAGVGEIAEVHYKIVKTLQQYTDYCILDVEVDESYMGRIIGKGGSNIKRMTDRFSSVGIDTNKSRRGIITISGIMSQVERVFNDLCNTFLARKLRYHEYQPKSKGLKRFSSMASLSSMPDSVVSYDDDDDEDYMSNTGSDLCSLGDVFGNRKSLFCKWRSQGEALMDFVEASESIIHELMDLFGNDDSVLLRRGNVIVVGQTDGDETLWMENVESKLIQFFEPFMCCDVSFHPRSVVDKTDIENDDLIVRWSEDKSTAVICGRKDAVEEKVKEFEQIKQRKQSVSTCFRSDKYLVRFLKKQLQMEESSPGSISFKDDEITFTGEILEVESVDTWKSEQKEICAAMLSELSNVEIEIPAIHSGSMRAECKESDNFVVEWISEKNDIRIYGSKLHVAVEKKRLEEKLYDLMNRKKNVHVSHHCEDPQIFAFVKECHEHIESLVTELGTLGSPDLLTDMTVTIHGEILESHSTSEWKEKCLEIVVAFFARYQAATLPVEARLHKFCPSLAKSRSGVVTEWNAGNGCFDIVGMKSLVDNVKDSLTAELQKRTGYQGPGSSFDPLAKKVTETITITESLMKGIEKMQSEVELRNVMITKRSNEVDLFGTQGNVDTAKAFIQAIKVEKLTVKRFGAYNFFKNNTTRWQIDRSEIENDCSISIKKLPDEEFKGKMFILLPKRYRLDVKVREGDITDEKYDMIVNTTNKTFSFDGPLSTCVFNKAGPYARITLEQIDSDMRISDSGNLDCKKILHVAIPKSNESMEDLIFKILVHADQIGMKSICLPTIGAGNGGWNSDSVSHAMDLAFSKFSTLGKTNLKKIRVILYRGMNSSDKQPFYDNISPLKPVQQRTIQPQNQPEPAGIVGFFSRIFSSKKPSVPEIPKTPSPISDHVVKYSTVSDSDASSNINERENCDYVEVLIVAKDAVKLQKAVEEIKNLRDRYVKEFVFKSEAVLKLDESDIAGIKKITEEMKVRTIVNTKHDIHSITIQGKDDDATKVKDHVQALLSASQSAPEFPKTWTVMPSSQKLDRVELASSSAEYREISSLFQKGNVRPTSMFVVQKIERVQNSSLYRQYQSKKDELIKRKWAPSVVERRLFHGTDSDTIDKICNDGFNRSYAGRNATLYGVGTYFSSQSSYSNSYSHESWGMKKMIIAEVLTGDYCLGRSSMKDAPRNQSTNELYDCVVDSVSSPTIFVVFRDWSAYPSYVVTYRAK